MSHYVYALAAAVEAPPFSGYVKIGHSNDPHKRMVTHRIGSPIPLLYAGIWRFKNRSTAIEVEGACHRHFAGRWIHGEWHAINATEVDMFISGFVEGRCLVTRSFDGNVPPAPRWPSTAEMVARFRELHPVNDNSAIARAA